MAEFGGDQMFLRRMAGGRPVLKLIQDNLFGSALKFDWWQIGKMLENPLRAG